MKILFSCTGQEKKDFEPFVEDHVIVSVFEGIMTVDDGQQKTQYSKGDIAFFTKNQLLKVRKTPVDGRPFMSTSVFLPKSILFEYADNHLITSKGSYTGKPHFRMQSDILLKSYFSSMVPYYENPELLTDNMAKIKVLELIELLGRETQMQNILFNFQESFKIDLEAYMNRNYMHNSSLEQFAKATGRSLSTFKRDFQDIFHETPNKWLIKKRLDLARHLISSKEKTPSEVYFDVGFVNFSHFSKSFKMVFGISPSAL